MLHILHSVTKICLFEYIFNKKIFILSEIETTICVCVYCHQFLYSIKHIFPRHSNEHLPFSSILMKGKKIILSTVLTDYTLYSNFSVYKKNTM